VRTYLFNYEQKLPIPLAEAWSFFSSPLNLAKITPPEMRFKVTSNFDAGTKIYEGMIITYKVSPLPIIKLNWMTEIMHVKANEYFVDEQRIGPFALWHHEHHFKEIKGGVQMTDIVNYGIPYGIIGRLSNKIFVEKQVKMIFSYREKAINDLFGVYRGT
jgi:ligand-binding SRPBCC domain-containing protein